MELNLENIEKIIRFRPTLDETAVFFGVSPDTIERKIKKWTKLTFRQFKELNSVHMKQKLRDRAFEMAMNGNTTMMIFVLKNLCGWTDKLGTESKNDRNKPIVLIGPNESKDDYPEDVSVIKMAYDPKNLRPPPDDD